MDEFDKVCLKLRDELKRNLLEENDIEVLENYSKRIEDVMPSLDRLAEVQKVEEEKEDDMAIYHGYKAISYDDVDYIDLYGFFKRMYKKLQQDISLLKQKGKGE